MVEAPEHLEQSQCPFPILPCMSLPSLLSSASSPVGPSDCDFLIKCFSFRICCQLVAISKHKAILTPPPHPCSLPTSLPQSGWSLCPPRHPHPHSDTISDLLPPSPGLELQEPPRQPLCPSLPEPASTHSKIHSHLPSVTPFHYSKQVPPAWHGTLPALTADGLVGLTCSCPPDTTSCSGHTEALNTPCRGSCPPLGLDAFLRSLLLTLNTKCGCRLLLATFSDFSSSSPGMDSSSSVLS